MDELIVNQIKYISSKRASALTGYAKDYVGQLVRLGKVDAKRVGRAWYVREDEILALAGKGEARIGAGQGQSQDVRGLAVRPRLVPVTIPKHALPQAIAKTWSDVRYFIDDSPELPISDKRDHIYRDEIAISNKPQIKTVTVSSPRIIDVDGVVQGKISKVVSQVSKIMPSDVIVIRREPLRQKYVATERYSFDWMIKGSTTVVLAALVALMMPIFL